MQTHKLTEVFVNNNGFHKTYFPGTGKLKTFLVHQGSELSKLADKN
jgi:hypothetical protein